MARISHQSTTSSEKLTRANAIRKQKVKNRRKLRVRFWLVTLDLILTVPIKDTKTKSYSKSRQFKNNITILHLTSSSRKSQNLQKIIILIQISLSDSFFIHKKKHQKVRHHDSPKSRVPIIGKKFLMKLYLFS